MNHQDLSTMKNTNMPFIVRTRTRLINTLLKKGSGSSNTRFSTQSFTEGPYSGLHMMHSYGTVMLLVEQESRILWLCCNRRQGNAPSAQIRCHNKVTVQK